MLSVASPDWAKLSHDSVHDSPRGAACEEVRQRRVAGGLTFERSAVHCAGGGFRAQQISRSNLYSCSAERHRSRNAFRIGNAASRNDGDAYLLHNLRHQCQGANLNRQIVRQEIAAMSPRLETLRNDGIGPVRFEPLRLVHGGCRREDLRTPRFHACQQFCGGQTEMKAHHGGLEFREQLRGFGTEWRTARPDGNGVRVDSERSIVMRQRSSSHRFALRTELGGRMAEEIDVERLRGLRRDRRNFTSDGIKAEHGAGE